MAATSPCTGTEPSGSQYVSFSLNGERYAVAAVSVREIIELTSITPVPHLPEYLKGVINVRGTIIPVVDLKLKFGMPSEGYRRHTCVIMIEFSGGVMGIIVDSVDDVVGLAPEAVSAPPDFGRNIRTEFIGGMARSGGELLIILDVERVLDTEGLHHLVQMRRGEQPGGDGRDGTTMKLNNESSDQGGC